MTCRPYPLYFYLRFSATDRFLHRVVNLPLRLFERQTTSHEEQDSLESVQIPGRIKDTPRLRDFLNDPLLFEVAEFRDRNLQLV